LFFTKTVNQFARALPLTTDSQSHNTSGHGTAETFTLSDSTAKSLGHKHDFAIIAPCGRLKNSLTTVQPLSK
jgi:hypothetical protein